MSSASLASARLRSVSERNIKDAGKPNTCLLKLLFHDCLVRIQVLGADRHAAARQVAGFSVCHAIPCLGGPRNCEGLVCPISWFGGDPSRLHFGRDGGQELRDGVRNVGYDRVLNEAVIPCCVQIFRRIGRSP